MRSQKGFILPAVIIGSLLIIFTLGFLSFRSSFSQGAKNQQNSQAKENDPYFGWKTYSNTKHKFTIRYPNGWYIREYGDFAANFVSVDPKIEEASPSAIKVRYSYSGEDVDALEFEKIYKLGENQKILEPLDVKSEITKIKNFKIASYQAIDFQIERIFSALTGPKKEFTHVYEIEKQGSILRFSNSAATLDQQVKFNGELFSKMISSLKFQK